MSRRAIARIDLGALKHNLQRVRTYAPNSRIMAAIKSDAYGHGALQAANALADADALAMATFEEAMQLRWAGEQRPIVLLGGITDLAEARGASEHRLQVVVHEAEQLAVLNSLEASCRLEYWIKIDTGMHRLGFEPAAALAVHEQLSQRPNLNFTGWMSHLACADDVHSAFTDSQLEVFRKTTAGQGGALSLANSAGIINRPDTHLDWVRPGIMLYGSSPMIGGLAADHDLLPVMSLESTLISVHQIPGGESIGYGQTWTCPETMPVGVVGIGYGDGYPRHVPNGTPVWINGKSVPIIGRVSMDMITVDLRGLPDTRVGDSVELWGRNLSVDDIAREAGTISYELFCQLTSRVEFTYRESGTP